MNLVWWKISIAACCYAHIC